MKVNSRLALFVVAILFAAADMKAQESSAVRPRTVTTTEAQQAPAAATAPQTAAPLPKPAEAAVDLPVVEPDAQKKLAGPVTNLTPSLIQARVSEARRM